MIMEKRPLGDTDFTITALSYGAMELRKMDENSASQILNAVLDQGINYIDTSPDYGPSEAMIGKAIAHRRDEYILATKCACNIDAAGQHLEPRHIYSRAQLMKNVENSLRLLKTDHLDVWQLHTIMPEDLPGSVLDEVLGVMSDLRRQGKVRVIGCTYKTGKLHDGDLYPVGFSVSAMKHFLSCDAFRVMQPVYGALARGCEDLISEAAARRVGVVARGSFRDYRGDQAKILAASGLDELRGSDDQATFLIRFVLSHPGVATMLVGTKDQAHLAANAAAAARGPLTAEVYEEAKRRLDGIGVKVAEG